MKLVKNRDEWAIEGAGKEKARIAHAVLENGRLSFEVARKTYPRVTRI